MLVNLLQPIDIKRLFFVGPIRALFRPDCFFHPKGTMMNLKKSVASLLLATTVTVSGTAHALPSLSFLIDGDTFFQSYSISNTSTNGESVVRFHLDLATIPSGGPFCFDTVSGGPCNPSPDQSPLAFSAINPAHVGFTSPTSVADGATVLDLLFNNFGAGETFSWDIDVDSASDITVFGNDLIGASAFVDFSNGQRLLGSLQAVSGSPEASTFTVTGTAYIPEPVSLALLSVGLLGLAWSRRKNLRQVQQTR